IPPGVHGDCFLGGLGIDSLGGPQGPCRQSFNPAAPRRKGHLVTRRVHATPVSEETLVLGPGADGEHLSLRPSRYPHPLAPPLPPVPAPPTLRRIRRLPRH